MKWGYFGDKYIRDALGMFGDVWGSLGMFGGCFEDALGCIGELEMH